MKVPTGGKGPQPVQTADPVTLAEIVFLRNSGTDSIVWMREEHTYPFGSAGGMSSRGAESDSVTRFFWRLFLFGGLPVFRKSNRCRDASELEKEIKNGNRFVAGSR